MKIYKLQWLFSTQPYWRSSNQMGSIVQIGISFYNSLTLLLTEIFVFFFFFWLFLILKIYKLQWLFSKQPYWRSSNQMGSKVQIGISFYNSLTLLLTEIFVFFFFLVISHFVFRDTFLGWTHVYFSVSCLLLDLVWVVLEQIVSALSFGWSVVHDFSILLK